MDHPRTGTGHPEQLKGKGGDVYSRHITAHDRIIYEVFEDMSPQNELAALHLYRKVEKDEVSEFSF